ncbi:MAG: zf-TFIIB domain-containing protein [Polyangia bacterium]|nr:zf-TFIIB domain-containing protein [Polyangia bacterium]
MLPRRSCLKCGVETLARPMGRAVADSCPRCGGLFFPSGSLDECLGQPGLSAGIAARESCCPVCFLPSAPTAPRCVGCGALTPILRCPAGSGHGPMQRAHVGGIVVEVCPFCEGVFLDRGELSRIFEAAKAPVATCPRCGGGLPDHKAGYLTEHGRICGACFRAEASRRRASEKGFEDKLDALADLIFSARRGGGFDIFDL